MNRKQKKISALTAAGLFFIAAAIVCAQTRQPTQTITWWDLLSPEEYMFYQTYIPGFDDDPNDLPPVGVNELLDNRNVRLAGYLVNLDGGFETGTDFLLVPTVGACVHVPPPPENQIVLAYSDTTVSFDLYTPVWVHGTLSVGDFSNEYADGLYTMRVVRVEPYLD